MSDRHLFDQLLTFEAVNHINEVVFDSYSYDSRIRGYRWVKKWWGTKRVLVFEAYGWNVPTAISAIVNPNPDNLLEAYIEHVPLIH